MRKIQKYFLLIFLFITSASFADDIKVNLHNTLNNWRIKNDVPGIILLINTPTYKDILISGTTTLHGKDPIKPAMLFGVGSITKTIISTMILRLEAELKLEKI